MNYCCYRFQLRHPSSLGALGLDITLHIKASTVRRCSCWKPLLLGTEIRKSEQRVDHLGIPGCWFSRQLTTVVGESPVVQPDWGDVAGGPHSHPRAGADLPAPAAAAGPGTENVGFSTEKRRIFPWKTGIFHCREQKFWRGPWHIPKLEETNWSQPLWYCGPAKQLSGSGCDHRLLLCNKMRAFLGAYDDWILFYSLPRCGFVWKWVPLYKSAVQSQLYIIFRLAIKYGYKSHFQTHPDTHVFSVPDNYDNLRRDDDRQELARLPTMGMVRFLSSATRLGLVDEAKCCSHGFWMEIPWNWWTSMNFADISLIFINHYWKKISGKPFRVFFLRWSQWWWLKYSVECRGWIGDGKCPIPNCGFWTSSKWSVAKDFSSARWDVLWAHAAGTHHPSQFYFILFPCSDVEGSNDGRWRISSLLLIPMKFLKPFAAPFRVSPKTETNSIRLRKNRITTWWLIIVCYNVI